MTIGPDTFTFQLSNNVAPTITSITVPLDPVDIIDQALFSVTVSFTDPAGANDEPYTCNFDMDSDLANDITVTGVTGTSCSATLSYSEPGVYSVTATVTDKHGAVSDPVTASDFIVTYDSNGGFVTGGGWINSPANACPDFCGGATGKANFGFVSKYKKGASVPTGQTEFNFKAGDLNFHSTSYDWLVIAGKKAMYKGDGTVNGDVGFTFQLNAIDGDLPGGDGIDRFRIKIKQIGGGVVYDNQPGAGDNDDPTTAIGGGSIKIHKQNNLLVQNNARLKGSGAKLSQEMLDVAVTQAIVYWSQQHLSPDRLIALYQVETRIGDLGGQILGTASETSNTVRIDRDAAGYGWVVGNDAVGGVNLVSAVTHEFGHILGFDHDHGSFVMDARLSPNFGINTRAIDDVLSLWFGDTTTASRLFGKEPATPVERHQFTWTSLLCDLRNSARQGTCISFHDGASACLEQNRMTPFRGINLDQFAQDDYDVALMDNIALVDDKFFDDLAMRRLRALN